MLNPIVIIFPSGNTTVVIQPNVSNPYNSATWATMWKTIAEECVQVINTRQKLTVPAIIEFVQRHPEWQCQAMEGNSLPTWCLVE